MKGNKTDADVNKDSDLGAFSAKTYLKSVSK